MAESERQRMIALTPAASSILSLVAQNPEVNDEAVDRLLKDLDSELEPVVREAVKIVRSTVCEDQPVFGTSSAAMIAQAFVKWAQQNAQAPRYRSLTRY